MQQVLQGQNAARLTPPPPAPAPICCTSPQYGVAGVLTCISHKEAPVQQLPLETHNTPLLHGLGLSPGVLCLPHCPLHHCHTVNQWDPCTQRVSQNP